MKLAFVLLAILAALMAVAGETKSPSPAAAAGGTATIVGATGATGAAAAGSTVPAIVKAGIPISVGNLTTTTGTTTATVQGATAGVTITGTGATGGFVGQPTIVGATGATVSIASPGAAIVGAAGASPAASGAAVISQASPSAAASGAASPVVSGAASPAASAVVIVISPSPAASGAASPAVSGAASPAVSGAASPAVSGAASPAVSGAASPAVSGAASPAASGAASPAVSGAASPAASGAASPVAMASPAALVSAADFFPPMPTYGQENLQFTCPNATMEAMVEVSLEPLLIGIGAVSSIKFAGCPSLMYVATKAGQIFEVTIDNSTSAVTQVRLILDLSNQIASPSTQASTTAGGGTSGGTSGGASTTAGGGASGGISGGASASSNAADQPGLLGMAFPPDFADSGLFYVYFSARSSSAAAGGAGGGASATAGGGASSATAGGATIAPSAGGATCGNEGTMLNHVNRLAEYRLDPSSGIANFSRTLLELRWPFANGNGDNSLEFAPGSNLLFLGVGDGGSSFDPFENAQNPDVLLGKVHVFDLSSLSPDASCNQTVLRLSELTDSCPDIAAAITTFATGLHSPAGFEFLNPSAELDAASCPGGANATVAGGANATAAGGVNETMTGGANATAAGGANVTMAGGANATAAGGANATMASGMNLTLSDLAPRLIAPDRGQGRYDEINIMEEIGANYGWDIIEGWSCIDQSLELCPESTSGMANATLAANQTAGGANATMAGGANATAAGEANATAAGGANETMAGGANATAAGGANATMAGGANLTATGMAVLPAAVIPHNCRRLYNPQAILGGRLYQGSELDPMLQGAYIFGATTSLQNGNESLPTGNGALYFLRPESFVGNAVADLTMCPSMVAAGGANATAAGGANATMAGGANATAAGGANATMAGGANATAAGGANATMAGGANATAAGGANATMGGITTTGSGVNTSFIPNSRLEVFPVTINYQFFPTQHFFTAMGADASRSRLFLGVSSMQGATGGLGGVFRLTPFNEGPQNPAIISATNLRPGQIVFSAGGGAGGANATAMASPSAAARPSPAA